MSDGKRPVPKLRFPKFRTKRAWEKKSISRYVSTDVGEPEIDPDAVHAELVEVERAIRDAKQKHNASLKAPPGRPCRPPPAVE